MSFQTIINTRPEFVELSTKCDEKLKDLYLHMVLISNLQKELKAISEEMLIKSKEYYKELS
jgi:hypothetical protein